AAERWRVAQHALGEGADDEAVIPCAVEDAARRVGFRRQGRLALLVRDKLDGGQHAATTDIADEWMIGKRAKPLHQAVSGLAPVFQQAILVKVKAREPNRRTDGMSGIG